MTTPSRHLTTTTSSTFSPSSVERKVALAGASYIFQRIRGQLGSKFSDMFGNDMPAALEEWAMGLSGFRQHELDRGLGECSSRKFAPTLGEFAQFCRPALDPHFAWLEAADGLKARDLGEVGHWSHPAVYRAARAMQFDFKRGSFQSLRVQWERILKQEFAKGWGDAVPPVPKRVEHSPTFTPMPASVRALLSKSKINL